MQKFKHFCENLGKQTNRTDVYPFGRGTTALFVALRAIAPDGTGEVILPDIICSTVLDAVLLAGLTPVFADVTPDRFALSADSVRSKITTSTRAIITTHLFGYIRDTADLREFGIPIIEDAVQGFGGRTVSGAPARTLGDISVIGFDPTKIVHGRGGVLLTDNPRLARAIEQVDPLAPRLSHIVPPYKQYRQQIDPLVSSLLCPFNDSHDNISQIQRGIESLSQNVQERNTKARYLRDHLIDLPLTLPEITPGDAIWRYTIVAPSKVIANRILRQFQLAGLPGARPYPALSTIFAPDPSLLSADLAARLVSIWVDSAISDTQLDRIIEIIRAASVL